MSISESLHFFRESLGKNQKDFASDIITPSYYNRVEHGDSNISAHILLELLQKNNISIHEFFIKMNDGKECEFIEWYKILNVAYYRNDREVVETTIKNIPVENHFNLVGKLLLQQMNKECISERKRAHLKKYLMEVNQWSEYHILLFILLTKLLTAEELILLFGIFAKNIQDTSTYKIYEKDIVLALLNIVGVCIKQKKINEAEYFLTLLPQVLNNPSYLLEKIISDFYAHLILITKNIEKELHLKTCYQLIELFKKYEMNVLSRILENLIELYS